MAKAGFTLAEVLITLGIIGIVVAMTMPVLMVNKQKKETVSRLKKTYSILSQAYLFSQNDNGFSENWIDTTGTPNTKAVKDYVHTYWLPYLQTIQECSKRGDCAYETGVTAANGEANSLSMVGNNRYTLILADGTLVAFVPFSWTEEDGQYWGNNQKFYVDINGAQKPNKLGRDVFILILDAQKHAIRGLGYNNDDSKINQECSKQGQGQCCAERIIRDSWEIKKGYPW